MFLKHRITGFTKVVELAELHRLSLLTPQMKRFTRASPRAKRQLTKIPEFRDIFGAPPRETRSNCGGYSFPGCPGRFSTFYKKTAQKS
jgi:hypothetical protein